VLAPVLALLALPLAASAADATSLPQPSALSRIDDAFAQGRIDAPTRAIYGLYVLKAPEKLPAEFRPSPGATLPRCATPLFHRAWLERDAFNAEQAADYASFAARPTYGTEGTVPAAGADTLVLVHYDAADGTQAAIANQVAASSDTAWNMEITGFGFRPPVPDGTAGGTSDTDIYLVKNLNYAYTASESTNAATTFSDATAFSVIDPALPNLETYVAHEFNHDSQYAYDAHEADLIYEATAVFIEDKVYDSVNDYLSFVPDFQTHPERNLSYATYDDSYMYGAGIWLRWLSDKHGSGSPTIVRQIWENLEQDDLTNSNNYFMALENTVLPAAGISGGVQGMEQEYAGYRWLSGANSDGWSTEASLWPTVAPIQQFTLTNGADGNTTPNAPQPLGVNYVEVDTTGGVAGDKLTFTLHGGTGVSWGVTKIEVPASGAATVTPSAMDSGDGVVRVASSSVNGFSKVVFAVTNLGTAGQVPDSLSGTTHNGPVTPTSFTYDVFYSADGKDPGAAAAASACKCDLATRARGTGLLAPFALVALAVGGVLRRRR